MKKRILLIWTIFLFLMMGCSSVPKEAPELSVELGNRIRGLEKAHIASIEQYFNLKRELIDEYMKEEWIPKFAEIFFSLPSIQEEWQEIVKDSKAVLKGEKSVEEKRLEFIINAGSDLQLEIDNERRAMMSVIDELEKIAKKNIRENYLEVNSINNAITSYLISANKLDETRKNYLNQIGIENEELLKLINDTEEITSSLTEKGLESLDKAEEFNKRYEEWRKED